MRIQVGLGVVKWDKFWYMLGECGRSGSFHEISLQLWEGRQGNCVGTGFTETNSQNSTKHERETPPIINRRMYQIVNYFLTVLVTTTNLFPAPIEVNFEAKLNANFLRNWMLI